MKRLRRVFLLWVGFVSVIYDQANKAMKEQQQEINKRFNRKAA